MDEGQFTALTDTKIVPTVSSAPSEVRGGELVLAGRNGENLGSITTTVKSWTKKILPRSMIAGMLDINERIFLGVPNWFRFHFQKYPRLPPGLQFLRDGGLRKIWDSVVEPDVGTIVIFGGYLGDSAQSWLDKFPQATIHVFEPVEEYASSIKRRFDGREVIVYPFGIAKNSENRIFVGEGDATSQTGVRKDKSSLTDSVRRAVLFKSVSVLREAFPEGAQVDVLEINIEGGEYELLPVLHSAGFLESVSNVFLQFHTIGNSTEENVARVRGLLKPTHSLVWSYELRWDFWRKLPQIGG